MKIAIYSDLHLEFGGMPRDWTPPECDVAILAGDIATGVVGVIWAERHFDVPVLYVPGNHEFYGKRVYEEHIEAMREKAEGTNVRILQNDAVEIDGVRFIGATLWTDYALDGFPAVGKFIAERFMNDYRQILSQGWPRKTNFSADYAEVLHKESRAFIDTKMRHFDGKKVVITHMAPSAQSIAPKYAGHEANCAYASNLDHLVARSDLWIHGHMHTAVDYSIGAGRVICNPRGYPGENSSFNDQLVVTI